MQYMHLYALDLWINIAFKIEQHARNDTSDK